MLRRLAIALLLAVLCAPAAFAQNDKQGSKDYPGLTRMPDHYIYNYDMFQYDAYVFPVTQNGKRTEERVEGKLFKMQYLAKNDVAKPSALQIVRNYQNAVKAAGGQILDEQSGGYWRDTTLLLTHLLHCGRSLKH